ncbi:flagellar basal body L-ring protein FlgH [Arenibaculum pallidiluteum]|uniref:flagellar basal body L-ring protein FlgH n=1 Tax=Arenibaculum pallidiluteum TaxID=2812559 RepID=UPI001A972EAE|nr:flagellar basal body L-ring protein FlgH [Arenibaculum pallidiluteum]
MTIAAIRPALRPALRLALPLVCAMALSACNATQRIADIGSGPRLSTIQNPQTQAGYTPVSLPMPAPVVGTREPNSLWRAGSRAFFKDQRAARVGDILTVTIDIKDSAKIDNETERTRSGSESLGVPNLLGFEQSIARRLNADPANAVDMSTDSATKGTGSVTRQESITLQVAALVTDVLPNGNLVIQGRQEVRVNFELRELTIAGVIRPEDIGSDNRVSYEKIAEARISYGGRGQITDVQQPRYGQQLFDIIMPF